MPSFSASCSVLSVLLLACASAGCATHPLGEDWATLGVEARERRAVDTLRRLVAGGVDGAGGAFADRTVSRCDADEVRYMPLPDGAPCILRWQDVESVDGQSLPALPSRPETLYVYLRADSPSLASAVDATTPVMAKVGFARPYVLLRSRPTWSRNRMLQALAYLRKRRKARERAATKAAPADVEPPAANAKPPAAPAEPAPEGDPELDAIETKLRRLQAWRDEGLISEEEYQAKKRLLLDPM